MDIILIELYIYLLDDIMDRDQVKEEISVHDACSSCSYRDKTVLQKSKHRFAFV